MAVNTTIHNCTDAKTFLARGNLAVQNDLGEFIAHLTRCVRCRQGFLAALEANLAKTICVLAAQAVREDQEGRTGEGVGLLHNLATSL